MHVTDVETVAFSPHGTRLASAGSDRIITIADARPWTAHSADEQEVLGLVEGLFARPLLRAEVIERIREHRGINEKVRALAVARASRYRPDPDRFQKASRHVVRFSDAAPGLYRQAFAWAQTACRTSPNKGPSLTTLGIAQYRLQRFADALATLSRAEPMNADNETTLAINRAVLAMTHYQLGHKREARAALNRMRDALKKGAASRDPEVVAFVTEAEGLIGK
jgi:hypothetical protein